MPLYTVTVTGSARQRAHIARYNFSDGTIGGPFNAGVANLILDRMENIYNSLSANLDAEWGTETISIINADEDGLIEQQFSRFGALSGDAFPPFITATLRFLRPGPQFRHGYKRFSGIPETYYNDGFFIAGFRAALELFITGLLLPITDPIAGTYRFSQVRQSANGQPLPRSEWLVAPFVAGVVQGLGTQNTRKD
jgi:hypothetical protein